MPKKRKTLGEVRAAFEKRGWKLLSKEYVNCSTRLEFECDKGHRHSISWSNFRKGWGCVKCSGTMKKTIEFISSKFSEVGYVVVSKEYVNSYTQIEFVCDKGHKHKMSWDSFRGGTRCGVCSGKVAHSYEHVKAAFEKRGWKLLSSSYGGNHDLLEYQCENNHIHSIRWFNFIQGYNCPYCGSGPVSKISQKWLDFRGISYENREKTLNCGDKKIKVDGYDPATNTVYEFLGDYWHGNPNVFYQAKIHPIRKKSYGQLFDETLERLFLLRQHGYNLEIIWEEDFKP